MSALHEHPFGNLTHPDPAQRSAAVALVERVRGGDREAVGLLDEFVEPVARLLVTFAWTVAPPLIVLGGGLETAADVLIPRLEDAVRRAGGPPVPVRATSLAGDAPLVGALHEARSSVDAELPSSHLWTGTGLEP
jgi:predicted NBD/HSP70 family sugar kinase